MEYIKNEQLKEEAQSLHDYTLNNRRKIHANPEMGMEEFETAKFIRQELDAAGIPWIEASPTGTVGIIEGSKDSDNILALRGDIDALRVTEAVDLEFKSKNEGLMHACGHDAHGMTLLSAGKILKEKYEGKFDGKIYLLFQPGEETTMGARAVVASGAVNDVKAFYGQHVWAYLETGKIAARHGASMAGAKVFSIKVKGQSGHGSALEKTKNPLVPASAIVLALQSIVSNNVSALDSGVVCVGGISGGGQFNAICDECDIQGTIRYTSRKMDETLCGRIEEISKGIAIAYGCEAIVSYGGSVPALTTDPKLTDLAIGAFDKVVGRENYVEWPLELGSEDFSEYCDIAPCAFGFIGCRNDAIGANQPHHSSSFKIDEDCLDIGVATYIQVAKEYFGIE